MATQPNRPDGSETDLSRGPSIAGVMAATGSLPTTPAGGSDTSADASETQPDPTGFLQQLLAPADRESDLGRLGDYRILGVLGHGGMGVVLKAEDPALHRTVALKVMRPEVAAGARSKDRFLREARSAAAVEHPRVVVIHQVGEWKNAPFLVMPLMSGQSLGSRMKNGPPILLVDALRFVREAADGLAAAHAKGLTHRDVKPDNIWLEDTVEGTHVRLLDFGLARAEESEPLTRTGAVVGTPFYMAPEQAAGEPVDARADLFSLGCVLYQLLTGKRPFSGPNLMAVLSSLASGQPAPPSDVASSIPPPLSDLTMRLLEKSPARRPASATEVSAELRRYESELADCPATVLVEPRTPIATAVQPASAQRAPRTMHAATQLQLGRGTLVGCTISATLSVLVAIGFMINIGAPSRPSFSVVTSAIPPKDTPIPPATGPVSMPPTVITSPRPEPLRVIALEVRHFSKTPAGDVLQGLLGHQTFSPLQGDRVQVTAKLSKTGYAYLIAFRPDGVVDLCFPASDQTPPPLADNPRYPLADGMKAYGLNEGAGLWVFAVVASDNPLPAYRVWLQHHFNDKPPWKAVPKPPTGIVWWDDGVANVDHISANGVAHVLRGKDETLEGPAATIKRLTDALRTVGKMDAASAIGFSVAPRE